ncbi:MAG TPA: HAD-IIIA family hydrolase, partial [Pyrinomonadaceae bacterium]|nr:HAD-IIIA family hydrolase [Pyrinomonadaceae bacterium]
LKESGYLIIVVTNQSGIGREVYTEAAMHGIHDEIQAQLDGAIDAFYFCPHLPCDGCSCRKPSLGMIEAACADFDIDMERSWMIGDKKIDVETGYNANILSALVLTGYGHSHQATLEYSPTLIATDLGKAAIGIVEAMPV